LLLLLLEILRGSDNLATKGAESEGVKKATLADFAGVGDPFAGPRLRPFVQENDSGAVDNVGLDATDVQHFLNLRNPNHVMVGGSPYLNSTMVFVVGEAERAKSTIHTIQTVHIAFALVGISM
jgi:hypothetical protein